MVLLLIQHPLPLINPPHPHPIRFVPSDSSGQSGPSLQDNIYHMGKRLKVIISLNKINWYDDPAAKRQDTMKPLLIQNVLPYLPFSVLFFTLLSFPTCSQKVHPKTISTIPASTTRTNINFSKQNMYSNPDQSILIPTWQPHPQLPQLPQTTDNIAFLLLIPPHMIFHPPHTTLPQDNLPLPVLLHLLINCLSRLDISPSLRPIFWAFDKEIPTGQSF